MLNDRIEIEEFIRLSKQYPVIDVRSEGEFEHAHFPYAHSMPLFNDEERKIVGITYKQQSREQAIKVGLDFFGPRMRPIVEYAEKLIQPSNTDKTILIHCWRGGMRSGAIAWLLSLYGFKTKTLNGGYKSFRTWALNQFEKTYHLRILSGYTGSGKTKILHELKQKAEAVIDLEGLANHKGSVFGGIGKGPQCSSEQFENQLALELWKITQSFENPTIWLESESNRIGNINLPHTFFNQMKLAERIHIEVPIEKRVENIMEDYGNLDAGELINATQRITRKLGGPQTKNVISLLEEDKKKEAFTILLHSYYDKLYESGTYFQPAFLIIDIPDSNFSKSSQIILNQLNGGNK